MRNDKRRIFEKFCNAVSEWRVCYADEIEKITKSDLKYDLRRLINLCIAEEASVDDVIKLWDKESGFCTDNDLSEFLRR